MASHAQISHDFAAPNKPNSFSLLLDPRATATIAAGGILLHLIARYILSAPAPAWQAPLIAVLILGGLPLLLSLARKLMALEFGSDHLAGISIITSVLLE